MSNNNLCSLDQAKKIKHIKYKGVITHYWVNLAAWGEGYKLMEAEEAETVVRGCSFAEMEDTYPAIPIEDAITLIEQL